MRAAVNIRDRIDPHSVRQLRFGSGRAWSHEGYHGAQSIGWSKQYPQVVGTGELPSNSNNVNSVGPRLVLRPDHAKRRARHFLPALRRGRRNSACRNRSDPQELHRCAEACGKSASLGRNLCMHPQIEARGDSRVDPALLSAEATRRLKVERSRVMQRPASHWTRNLIQNRAVRPLICQHCDDIFSASNFAAHFNTTRHPCAAKVLRAAPQCRCDQTTLSLRGSDESSASR